MPVIMKEGIQYAYTEDAVKAHTLSYAEYEALPTSQKMNGDIYLIPDKQPDGTNPTSRLDDLEDEVSELKSNLNNLIKSTSSSLTFDSTGRSTINYRIDKILGIGVISADYTCTLRYLSDTQTLVYLRNKDTLALITSGVTATVRITYIS